MTEDEKPLTPLAGTLVGPYREPPGEDLSRILSLSDGIFAFAMTLLVVNLTGLAFLTCGGSSNPCSSSPLYTQILGSWSAYVGYATVFFILALYWTIHHRTFRYIERYDAALVWLNIVFLLCIAAMPFVLEVTNKYTGNPSAIILFSVATAATGFLIGAIWRHASGGGHLLDPKLDPKLVQYYTYRGYVVPIVFLCAIPVALIAPSYATIVWIAAFPASLATRKYGGP